MINRWKKFKSYLVNNISSIPSHPLTLGMAGSNPFMIFMQIGAAIFSFLTKPAVQLSLFVVSGVMAHQKAMKLKGKGADVLLQKYGTGGGIPVIYGTRRVGSTVVHMETVNNKELFIVYAIAGHEIDSFDLESIHLDGRTIKDSTIYRQGFIISDGTTRVTSTGGEGTRAANTNFYGSTSAEIANILGGAGGDNPRMVFNLHKGTTSQAADPMMVGCIDRWTTDHKLTGITYIAANYEYDTRGMFTGIPNLTVVVKGKKVYDPRSDATAYSSNAALCLLDYLKDDDYGKGLANSDIDLTSFSTAANDCDVAAATLSHTGVSVGAASTTTDVVRINASSRDIYNKFKIGNKFTISDGSTTYVNNKVLIDKDVSDVEFASNDFEALLILNFEDGAVDTAITSDTTCTFTETQIRFDCNGVLDTEETVLNNAQSLIANMRGIFSYSGGKYSIKVEGTESSVVTLDEDDILDSGIELSLENKEAKYNKVEAEFYNAQKRYESDTTYYTGESSDNFLSEDGSEILETRIDLPFCTNQRIAYNHAKALLKRSRASKTISFVATPKVLKALVGEVITITNSNLGLSSALYRITNMVIMPDLNIQVTAIEYQADVYGYVAPPDEEIGIISDPVDGHRVLAPSGLTFTEKNTSTGESANLTWTDSSYYPSYEFRVIVEDSGGKTIFDQRVEDTICHLKFISVGSGYVAKVSAINVVGIESAQTTLNINVGVYPIHTVDIGQGSIGGFNFNATKMYYGTGTFNNSNTSVYFDNTGQFSLKDKLSFNGTTLAISGNLTVENTIDAGKITLDGQDLSVLLSASGSGTTGTLTSNTKRTLFNYTDPFGNLIYGLYVDAINSSLGIGTLTDPSSALHIRHTTPHIRLEDTDTNEYVRIKGDSGNMILEVDLPESDANSYLGIDVDNGERARFTSSGLSVTGNATISGDLTVSGTTTSIDTTNLDVKDKNITLNYGSGDTSSNADGAGITIQDAVNSSTDATFTWNATDDNFELSHGLDFGDSAKIRLGTDNDLQIYHDGSNARIREITGELRLQTTSSGVNALVAKSNAAVELYHAGSKKLETTSTGIDVTGNILLDDADPRLYFQTGSSHYNWKIAAQDSTNKGFEISSGAADGAATNDTYTPRIVIEADTGDVGIGTSSPAFSSGSGLEIERSGTATLRLQDSGNKSAEIRMGSDLEFVSINSSSNIILTPTANVGIGQSSPSEKLHVNGNIRVGSTDKLYFGGTTNYVSGSNGSNYLHFFTNNSERVRIDSSGQLGIGTSSPATKLHVETSSDQIADFYSTDTDGYIRVRDSNDSLYVSSDNAVGSFGGNAGANANNINISLTSGNVGIGTTSPAQKLHIKDTNNPASPNGSVIIEGQRDGTANLMELRARDNSSTSSALPNGQGGIIRMNGFDGTDFEEMAFIGYQADGAAVADGDAPSRLIFGTTTDGSGATTEKMRLDNAGRLGLGTTSPSYKLHLDAASDGINISGSSAFVRWNSGDMQIRNAGSYSMAFDTYDGSALTEKMTIDTSGNVGINRTSPSDKLDINGTISLKNNSATDAHYIHMPRGGGITFYGDANQHHGIFSRNQSNSAADDIMISTYGALYVDLDSNDNNSASADFIVGKHNSTSNNLFNLSGETGNLTILGNITAYGSPSDLRLKENIATIENPLDKVSQLRGVTFNYKEDGSKSTGLIAQELEKVLPEVVYETEDINDSDNKFKAVRYGNVVGLLVEAIKELKAEVEELKKNSHPPKGLHDLDGSKDILEKIKKLEKKYA